MAVFSITLTDKQISELKKSNFSQIWFRNSEEY